MSLVELSSFRLTPYSIPIPKSLLEVSSIKWPICPVISSKTLGKSIHKLTTILILVWIILYTFSMLQPILKLPNIKISIAFFMLPFPIRQASPPGSFVLLYLFVLIFSGIAFTVTKPVEGSFPMFFIFVKRTNIHVSISIYLTTTAFFLVMTIAALVYMSVTINSDALTVLLLIPNLPQIYFLLWWHHPRVLELDQLRKIYNLINCLEICKKLNYFVVVHTPYLPKVFAGLLW